MGNITGCRRRNGAERRITRSPAEEEKYIKQIFDFDWNQGLKKIEGFGATEGPLTVEEIIALRLTNDNAEPITPQVAHVAFTEFKKFMFLNRIYLNERELSKQAMVEEVKTSTSDLSFGLYAPPLIDSVWTILVSLDVPSGNSDGDRIYTAFCKEIFGCTLEKPLFRSIDKEEKISPDQKYDDTWRYVQAFKHELNPYLPLWPEISHENYETEYNSVSWLTPKEIEDLVKFLDEKVNADINSVDCDDLVAKVTEYMQEFMKQRSVVMSKHKSFAKTKFKPSAKKNKATTVSKIYKILESESLGSQALRRRLSQKYCLDDETAKSWWFDFTKFVTLKMIETDPDVNSTYFPGSVSEQVWATFQELGYYYRETFKFITPENSPFPESPLTNFHKGEETAKRYSETLDLHKEIFTEDPVEQFWETAESRFQTASDHLDDDQNRRLAVNVYRLLVSRAVEKTLDTCNNLELVVFDGIEGKDYLKSDEGRTASRAEAQAAGTLLGWRENFPHFSNVFFRHELSEKKYFQNKFSDGHQEAIALGSGGYLFYLNPFNDLSLQLAQLPKLPEVKTKSLDDIADYAETSYNFDE